MFSYEFQFFMTSCENQELMIRMEGGGCGGGVVGEQKDELHEHVPSSENSLLKGGFHSSVHAHA